LKCQRVTHSVIVFILTVRLLYNVICCRCPPFCCRCVFVCLMSGSPTHPWCGATRFLARDTPTAATSPYTPPCHKDYVALPRRVTPAFCTNPQILLGTLSADSALTLFMCSILMLSINTQHLPHSHNTHYVVLPPCVRRILVLS